VLQKPDPSSIFNQRVWEGAPLGADDHVICADDKTRIQASRRKQPTLPSRPIVPRTSSTRPFACYLTRWRMGIAVQLLEDTDLSRLLKRPPASALARAQPSVSGRRSDQLYSRLSTEAGLVCNASGCQGDR
jgi:hypothetical protein